jgi:maltose-binding protein MalE
MKRIIILLLSLTTFIMLEACSSNNSTIEQQTINVSEGIQVIQFHSAHRCMTCNKIEELTKQTLEANKEINFKLVDVDDPSNEAMAEEFEATGTALFLFNPANGTKKDLTDFAFLHAGNEEEFVNLLQKEIEDFK